MVFIYLTKTGYLLSQRPYSDIRENGWELITSYTSMENAMKVAERKYKNYTIDDILPKVKKPRKPRGKHQITKKTSTHGKPDHWRRNKSKSMMGHKRYNDPWKSYRSRAKYGASCKAAWEARKETYWVVRPDGVEVRLYLPDGKHTIPEGWRFGRPSIKAWIHKKKPTAE